MRVFVLSLFLFIILITIILAKRNKGYTAVEHFEESETPLEEMDGLMKDPTMTFSTNVMKGPDDKLLNEGKTVKGYKSSAGYVFKADEVSKTFPLAVQGEVVEVEPVEIFMYPCVLSDVGVDALAHPTCKKNGFFLIDDTIMYDYLWLHYNAMLRLRINFHSLPISDTFVHTVNLKPCKPKNFEFNEFILYA